jgi:Fe-S cluster assembly protein SufD
MANNVATLKLETGFSKNAIETLSAIKNEPDWMCARRLEAWHLYEETPMPASNDELWRRTSLKDLKFDGVIPFAPVALGGMTLPLPSALPLKFQEIENDVSAGGVLVQYNSMGTQTRLADDLKKRGVIFTDLDTAVHEHPELVKQYFMTRAVTYSENRYKSDKPRTGATGKHEGGGYGDTIGDLKFAALHGAFFSGGTFLYVPRGVVVDLPLQSLTYFDAANLAMFTHTLVILEEGAAVTLVENYASKENEPQRFSNGAVELILKPGSSLQYFHLQDFARNVWHFSSQTALLENDSTLTWLNGTLGSQTTKGVSRLQIPWHWHERESARFLFRRRQTAFRSAHLSKSHRRSLGERFVVQRRFERHGLLGISRLDSREPERAAFRRVPSESQHLVERARPRRLDSRIGNRSE